jgi:hypothetical protein
VILNQHDKWVRISAVICLVVLLMLSTTGNAWASKLKSRKKIPPDNTVIISLDISNELPRNREITMFDNPYSMAAGDDEDASINQVFEVGQQPGLGIGVRCSTLIMAPGAKPASNYLSARMTTTSRKLHIRIKLIRPSGKNAAITDHIAKPQVDKYNAANLFSKEEPLPGGPVTEIGNYVVILTVSPEPNGKPLATITARFIVMPIGFISIKEVSDANTYSLDANAPIKLQVALSTTSTVPVQVGDICTKIIMYKQTNSRDIFQFSNTRNIPGLPASCTITTTPKQYLLDLTKDTWTQQFTSWSPMVSLHAFLTKGSVYSAFGRTSGTYNGLHWYRSWDMGEIHFK